MSTNDFVKQVTAQFATWIDPENKPEVQSKHQKHPYSHRWFGLLPFSISMLRGRRSS
ncbi:YqzE family protein [Bacillaceae bacterium SIJ1]|uniref:YqzE family protein n=1 Tax=Litoribacterium kuwaitense TaxID=1398745 RepID=UPI0013E9C0DE|nr:YqzE family protein [Litoribacterium kuwaitense]NGP43581.1 YqzE family protein [Litoribacterium kuwaitense]